MFPTFSFLSHFSPTVSCSTRLPILKFFLSAPEGNSGKSGWEVTYSSVSIQFYPTLAGRGLCRPSPPTWQRGPKLLSGCGRLLLFDSSIKKKVGTKRRYEFCFIEYGHCITVRFPSLRFQYPVSGQLGRNKAAPFILNWWICILTVLSIFCYWFQYYLDRLSLILTSLNNIKKFFDFGKKKTFMYQVKNMLGIPRAECILAEIRWRARLHCFIPSSLVMTEANLTKRSSI